MTLAGLISGKPKLMSMVTLILRHFPDTKERLLRRSLASDPVQFSFECWFKKAILDRRVLNCDTSRMCFATSSDNLYIIYIEMTQMLLTTQTR